MKKRIVVFHGGLGNQLFQYIYLLYLQNASKKTVFFNISMYKAFKIHTGFLADRIFKMEGFTENCDNFAFFYRLIKRSSKFVLKLVRQIISTDSTENPNFNSKYYIGFWQDVKYYEKVKHLIPQLINDISKYCGDSNLKQKIICDKNSVSIHVRRGDYCNNNIYVDLTNSNYYKASIKQMYLLLDSPNFYVFSDDIEWVKKYFSMYKNMIFIQYDNQSALGDLALMSLCKNAIIANSSFSWWGAAIMKKQYVIYPSKYEQSSPENNLCLRDWIKIDI